MFARENGSLKRKNNLSFSDLDTNPKIRSSQTHKNGNTNLHGNFQNNSVNPNSRNRL